MLDDRARPEPHHFSVHYTNVNNGVSIGDQNSTGGAPAANPAVPGDAVPVPIAPAVINEAVQGFVVPGWMPKAEQQARRGVVFLTGDHGSGRKTAALYLLSTWRPNAVILHLPDRFDFAAWEPRSSAGYVVDGAPESLLRSPSALSIVRSRLLNADALLLVVLPAGVRFDGDIEAALSRSLVRCHPPPAEEICRAKLAASLASTEEASALLSALSSLGRLLPVDASPADAVELAEALMEAAGETPVARERQNRVISRLDEIADLQVNRFLHGWTSKRPLAYLLISAAVFVGHLPRTVLDQALRLAREFEGDTFEFDQDDNVLLDLLLNRARAQVITMRLPEPHLKQRLCFSRSRWSDAILRQAWQEPFAEGMARWLGRLDDSGLTEAAGRALALSVSAIPQAVSLSLIKICAESPAPRGQRVAATALRAFMQEPDRAPGALATLHAWAAKENEWLRLTVAFACRASAPNLQVRSALSVLRSLVNSLDRRYTAKLDNAVRAAFMKLFLDRDGERSTILYELASWHLFTGPESVYAAHLFPHLLSSDPRWFQRHAADEDILDLLAALINRAARQTGPTGLLSRALADWQLMSDLEEPDAEAFETLLGVMARDDHPFVAALLRSLSGTP